nr:hypothetical protein [Tanacetum cinerariifolium]
MAARSDMRSQQVLPSAHLVLSSFGQWPRSRQSMMNTIASAITCLAINQKSNFSRYILLSLVNNIEVGVPVYMFPRFLQLIVDHQLEDMSHHQDIYGNPSLTKKVIANMKRVGTSFSRVITPLFENMLVPAAEEVGQAQEDVVGNKMLQGIPTASYDDSTASAICH